MWGNQRGVIVPIVLFGITTILSGIGLFIYFQYYPRKSSVDSRAQAIPSILPRASVQTAIFDFESCVRAGNPVAESYPRICRADGKAFTEVILDSQASPSPATSSAILFENYVDADISLYYPSGFVSQEVSIANRFSRSERTKFLSYMADQSNRGFTLELWSNKEDLSVVDWWNEQFKDGGENVEDGMLLRTADLALGTERIGIYEVYTLSLEAPGVYKLFRFKNSIVVFSSTMSTDMMKEVIGSIK